MGRDRQQSSDQDAVVHADALVHLDDLLQEPQVETPILAEGQEDQGILGQTIPTVGIAALDAIQGAVPLFR
ncbi:MAG TPA: hypothetical protein VFR55_00845 [Dehalococcoidia bacterium]|nr:hypothetical protein [Dehalococcoidia bacterium]